MLPPGPTGLFLVGSLFQYKGPESNLAWTRTYGPIYSVNMAGKRLVYLNTLRLVERYMEGEAGELLLDRPPGPAVIGQGLLFGSGENWWKNRAAATRALRWESSIQTIEDCVKFELGLAVQSLQSSIAQEVLVGKVFLPVCADVIAGLLRGSPLSVLDPDRQELLKVVQNLAVCDLASPLTQISLKHPKLRGMLSALFATPIVDVPATVKLLHGLIRKWIRETAASLPPAGYSSDGKAAALQEADEEQQATSECPFSESKLGWIHKEKVESFVSRISQQPEFSGGGDQNDAELIQSLGDFFFGGVTSTLSGVEFVLMYMSKHPHYMRQAQEEIDRVAGNEGEIRWSMGDRMPFVRACITESLRLGCVTPSSLPHVTTVDTEIEGYTISKGTSVMASIYSLHRDPEFYKDSEEFQPLRHIDAHGNFLPPFSFRPFGVGARRCVGETLAEMQLFLYITGLLRRFDVRSVDSVPCGDMPTHMRIVHRLVDFKCVFTPRTG